MRESEIIDPLCGPLPALLHGKIPKRGLPTRPLQRQWFRNIDVPAMADHQEFPMCPLDLRDGAAEIIRQNDVAVDVANAGWRAIAWAFANTECTRIVPNSLHSTSRSCRTPSS